MRKIIAAFNMTLDGNADHTAGIVDAEIHQHYTNLLNSADAILYGRTTYYLMEYWREVLKNPTGNKGMDEFAVAIDRIPKIVFSHTLKTIDWETASLAKKDLKEEVLELKQGTGKDVLVGSRSLIIALLNLGLVDEFQINVFPVLAGSGLSLFENIKNRINLKLLKTKVFSCSIIFYYQPVKS